MGLILCSCVHSGYVAQERIEIQKPSLCFHTLQFAQQITEQHQVVLPYCSQMVHRGTHPVCLTSIAVLQYGHIYMHSIHLCDGHSEQTLVACVVIQLNGLLPYESFRLQFMLCNQKDCSSYLPTVRTLTHSPAPRETPHPTLWLQLRFLQGLRRTAPP